MKIYGGFPAVRMRRMRRDEFSRRLMRETMLGPGDLIYPVFILDGKNRTEKVASMPGVERFTVDKLLPVAEECLKLGVAVMALFPAIDAKLKSADGREAFNPKGLVPRAVAALKKRFPELGLMTDVALDPYTSHGQDGVIDESGYILNDETLDILVKHNLVQNVREMGAYLKSGLESLRDEFEIVGDVRGLGLKLGIEFVEDKASKTPSPRATREFTIRCREKGLIMGNNPEASANIVRILPAFTITRELVDRGVGIMREALAETTRVLSGDAVPAGSR